MESQYSLRKEAFTTKNHKVQILLNFINVLCLGIGLVTSNFNVVAAAALIQMAFGMLALLVRGYNLLSFPVVFYGMCYLFHGGYLFLMLFNQRAGNLYMFREYLTADTQVQVGKFVLLFFAFLLLGMTSRPGKIRFVKESKPVLTLNQTKIIGGCIFLLCLGPRLYVDLKFVFEYLETGIYKTMDSMNNYILILADGFYVGGILLIIGYRNHVKKAVAVLAVCFMVLAVSMISGNRGIKVAYFLALIVFYFAFVEKGKLKATRLFLYIVFGYTFLALIATFGDLREGVQITVSSFINVFLKNFSYKLIVDQLGEFGYAAFSLGATVESFGEIGYLGGKMYLLSWLQIFPNVGGMLDGFSDSLNYVMMLPSKYRYSLGGSLLGEYFANFGYLAFVFSYLLGRFIRTAYQKLQDAILSEELSAFALLIILAIPKSFIWIRSVFNEFPRSVIWYFVMIIALKLLLYRKKI